MSIVRSPVRSVVRSPVRGVLGGGVTLLGQATAYLAGVEPYHWFDFINDRCLYASNDVGGVSGATGYSFARASAGYYTNLDGTLTSFASGALRRGTRGVLIEGARTNLLLRSQEFDNASWTQSRATVTANAVAAPDGTTTADKLIEDATAANDHRVFQNVTTTAAAWTVSIFFKQAERNWAYIRINNSGSVQRFAFFNLATGAVGTTSLGITATISARSDGWYFCTATIATALAGSNPILFGTASADNTPIYDGNGTSGVYIWQADAQLGAFASSPIVTTTASATRAADVLTCTAGVSYPLSLWAEFERAVDTGGAEYVLSMQGSGGVANSVQIFVNTNDQARMTVDAASVRQADISPAGAIAVNSVTKVAGRTATNSAQLARNGTLGTEDTVVTAPGDPTLLSFSTVPLFGYIRRAAIFNSALSDANLQSVTT